MLLLALSKTEIISYIIIHGLFLFAGFYNVYSIRDTILGRSYYYGFTEGWKFLGRYRDNSNHEWEMAKTFLWDKIYFYIFHIVVCEICRIFKPKKLVLCHIFVGLAFILASYNAQAIFLVGLQILTFYYIPKYTDSAICTWLLAGLWEIIIMIVKIRNFDGTFEQYYQFLMIVCWNLLKSLSFALGRINSKTNEEKMKYTFTNFVAYYLYFPTLIYGPMMIYDRYKSFMEKQEDSLNTLKKRLTNLLLNLAKILFWIYFMDFALHYFYVFCLERNFYTVKLLNSWGLYGFGYLMGIFFLTQYVVCYGVGISIAKFENIDAPNPPKCVGRIHFYSDMWKYFDQGLYEFLFRYVYASLCSKSSSALRKFLASLATFAFIYLWHGPYTFVLVWSILNFLCVTAEKLCKIAIKSEYYKKTIGHILSVKNQSRLNGLIVAQIFIPSAISNFYFFGGIDIGNYFMERTYQSFVVYLVLTLFGYSLVQCAELIWQWEGTRNCKRTSKSTD